MTSFAMVPFLAVESMESSCRFYVQGLGFDVTNEWVVDGQRRWCQLDLNGAALMLQRFPEPTEGPCGRGVCLYVMCDDAIELYRQFMTRGLEPQEPFVGNGLWVTTLVDPDGYHIAFESPTDVPEETRLSEWHSAGGAQ